MIEPSTLPAQIEAWTREAVARWGDDWQRICAYLETRMVALPPDARRPLEEQAALTLANGEDGVRH